MASNAACIYCRTLIRSTPRTSSSRSLQACGRHTNSLRDLSASSRRLISSCSNQPPPIPVRNMATLAPSSSTTTVHTDVHTSSYPSSRPSSRSSQSSVSSEQSNAQIKSASKLTIKKPSPAIKTPSQPSSQPTEPQTPPQTPAGLAPPAVGGLDVQVQRALRMIRSRETNLDKYLYLSTLKKENVDLFYRLLMDHGREMMPLVYTPTIGDVCLQYSTIYTKPEALYISINDRKSIRSILKNWSGPTPEICVVTDGSRILGLGDLGINGVGITVGKLSLYTAAAGIDPQRTLPIVLDCGTDNETNLKDDLYLGLRQGRPSMDEQQAFMDDFMQAAAEVFPEMVIQFEDFDSQKAFGYLDRYRDQYKCFNDDIQGTGAVVLAGYIGAVDLSNVPLEEQRLVFMGAGSAGVGVAKQLVEYYTRRGLTEQQARDKFYLVDTKGLVTSDRGDRLADHKTYFARTDNNSQQYRTLEEVIAHVKPTALVGLTATHGVFTEPIVRALQASVEAGGPNRRPILFPLSNPLTKAECTFKEAVSWTNGNVIFASGSPFSSFSVTQPTKDKNATPTKTTYHPNQGNNVYVFPGIGLGAILAKASRVTDDMIYTSAATLAECLTRDELAHGLIYPRIERVREASLAVARDVMKAARRGGVSDLSDEQWKEWEGEGGDEAMTRYILDKVYDPRG